MNGTKIRSANDHARRCIYLQYHIFLPLISVEVAMYQFQLIYLIDRTLLILYSKAFHFPECIRIYIVQDVSAIIEYEVVAIVGHAPSFRRIECKCCQLFQCLGVINKTLTFLVCKLVYLAVQYGHTFSKITGFHFSRRKYFSCFQVGLSNI